MTEIQDSGMNTLVEATPVLDANSAWEQVLNRNPKAGFYYAVTTTGVFCRPSCSSRRPLRQNVRFFGTVADASRAGFRPCQRCKPSTSAVDPVEQVRTYLEAHLDRTVSLEELSGITGQSPFTVQRSFKKAMGVSPLHYQRALRASSLRSALKKGESVTEAIYDAGYSSSSRAYDDATLGMTPGRFVQGGKGEEIRWACAPTPFGWVIVGTTERGICWLALGGSAEEAEASLREEFPLATLRQDPGVSQLVDAALDSVRDGSDLDHRSSPGALDLRGTVFQLRVWQALRQIPRGETKTYSQLAREMGEPNATRAVARACALNRVSILVPCHRVVGASGSLTGYRWGVDRKRQLLEAESSAG